MTPLWSAVLVLIMASSYLCSLKVTVTNVRTDLHIETSKLIAIDYTTTDGKSWTYNKEFSNSDRRLANTQKVSFKTYPFMARLTFIYDHFLGMCGGTLIHPKYILSAKHCQESNLRLLLTCMSEEYSKDMAACRGEGRLGYKTIALQTSDLLVVIVTEKYTATRIKPLVPQEFTTSDLKNCYSLGWGHYGPNKDHSAHLRRTMFTVRFFDEQAIAVFSEENNACKGDSGGPLICNKKIVGVATTPNRNDCDFGMGVSYYVNMNTNLHFVNEVIAGQYDQGVGIVPNWTLIIFIITVVSVKSLGRMSGRMSLVIGLVMLASVLGQDDSPPAGSSSEGTGNATEDFSGAIVTLYLIDINDEAISVCSGVCITGEWIVSSARCFRQATSDCQLKVCPDADTLADPTSCSGSSFAQKVVFPRHTWYNNIAFVFVDGIKQNTSVKFTPKGKKPDLSDCKMMGLNTRGIIADLDVKMRRSCRVGYYCVDERTGWACGFTIGSLLVCSGQARGIYVKSHPVSCKHRWVLSGSDDNDHGNSSKEENRNEPSEEDHWALLFFISFDAYEDLINKVLNGTFFATEVYEHEED